MERALIRGLSGRSRTPACEPRRVKNQYETCLILSEEHKKKSLVERTLSLGRLRRLETKVFHAENRDKVITICKLVQFPGWPAVPTLF